MTHIHKDVTIHAPLAKVYGLARDPRHWADWFVGISEARDLTPEEAPGRHEYLTVGTRFPLAQTARQEHLGEGGEHWVTHTSEPPECARVGTCCNQLMLSGDQEWTYLPSDGGTKISVDLDFDAPETVAGRPIDPAVIEDLEARALELSLANLKALCE